MKTYTLTLTKGEMLSVQAALFHALESNMFLNLEDKQAITRVHRRLYSMIWNGWSQSVSDQQQVVEDNAEKIRQQVADEWFGRQPNTETDYKERH